MSDSDPSELSNPQATLISDHCPKMDHAPTFHDGSEQQQCKGCDTPVFNLSALTEQQARAFIDDNDDICIRYEGTQAGEPIFRKHEKSFSRSAAFAGGLSLALGMTAACGVQTNHNPSSDQESTPEPTTNKEQTASTIVLPKSDAKARPWVGRVAPKWSKEVRQQMAAVKDEYTAGKMSNEEYSQAISAIKQKAREDKQKALEERNK